MAGPVREVPWGIQLLNWICLKCCPQRRFERMFWHKGGILFLTYLAYMCYHMSRKPISVVKNVLSLNCSTISPPPEFLVNDTNRDTWCDWAPFSENLHLLFMN